MFSIFLLRFQFFSAVFYCNLCFPLTYCNFFWPLSLEISTCFSFFLIYWNPLRSLYISLETTCFFNHFSIEFSIPSCYCSIENFICSLIPFCNTYIFFSCCWNLYIVSVFHGNLDFLFTFLLIFSVPVTFPFFSFYLTLKFRCLFFRFQLKSCFFLTWLLQFPFLFTFLLKSLLGNHMSIEISTGPYFSIEISTFPWHYHCNFQLVI